MKKTKTNDKQAFVHQLRLLEVRLAVSTSRFHCYSIVQPIHFRAVQAILLKGKAADSVRVPPWYSRVTSWKGNTVKF